MDIKFLITKSCLQSNFPPKVKTLDKTLVSRECPLYTIESILKREFTVVVSQFLNLQ